METGYTHVTRLRLRLRVETSWSRLETTTAPAETTIASPVATRNQHMTTRNQTMMNRDLHCDSQPAVATRNLWLRLEISVATRDHRCTHTVGPSLSWAQSIEPNDLNCGLFAIGPIYVYYLGRLRIWTVLLLGCLCYWAGYCWT